MLFFVLALTLGVSPFALAQSGSLTIPVTLPTTAPTTAATSAPTTAPTTKPTTFPTTKPTTKPTSYPTTRPTTYPTSYPTTAAETPVLIGPITELASYGYNTCPPAGQAFIPGYGCIPITINSRTTIVGTIATGLTAQVYGTVSGPNVTATYVLVSGAPSATPSPASTPTPSIFPTATPTTKPTTMPTAVPTTASGTFMNFQNAQDWASTFNPWAPTSVWNTPVSANPKIASYSANVISNQFPAGLEVGIRSTEAGQYDYNHVRFFAKATDPVINIACNQFCGPPDNGGVPATMHMPAVARPAGGTDSEMHVVQPSGTEIDFWAVYGTPGSDTTWSAPHDMQTRDWQTGDTITAGNVTNCGNMASGIGWVINGPGPTAAGYCQSPGQVLASELISGHINHALHITGECAIGNQYPSQNGASTQQCTSGVGPPLGGREWYDVPCATTQATSLKPWEKAILCALNQYGAFFADNGNGGAFFTGGLGAEFESEEPWRDYTGTGPNKSSYTSPYAPLAAQGWSPISIPNAIGTASGLRWFGADPWNIWSELGESEAQFASHIFWLDPCSAQGTC